MKYYTNNISKVFVLTLLTLIFLFSLSLAHAQDDAMISGATVTDTPTTDSSNSNTDTTTNASAQTAPAQIESSIQTNPVRVEPIKERNNAIRKRIENTADNAAERTVEAKNLLEDKRNTLQERRSEVKEKLIEKKEERKKNLNEKTKERILAYTERIIKRLNIALDRFEKIAERVDSRISKLEEKFSDDRGIDLSGAKVLLNVANEKIAEARNNISSIRDLATNAINTDNPKESFTEVQKFIKSAIDSLKDAHRALVEAIKAVKAGVGAPSSNTTTNENSEDTKVE